jgi:nitrite reductase/ring-hydroxylating ferredoxin subunit
MLIGAGVAVTVPAAATGLADWSALHRDQQRVGLVHAVCQSGAAALFLGSLAARISGRHRYGRVLSGCGLAVATAGSYLGGHLALRLGAGASHAEQVSHLAGLGWHDLCGLEQLPDHRPVRRQLGYLSLLVYRQGAEVNVLSDRCSHLGGPLHQGRIVVERGAACVACPWHGSTFAIADGAVVHGPATARQPAFETRVTAAGRVELRPRP